MKLVANNSDGQIMLGRKKSTIFVSNAPIRLVNMCTEYKWGSSITPKTPSGGHASLDATQQPESHVLLCQYRCLSLVKSW